MSKQVNCALVGYSRNGSPKFVNTFSANMSGDEVVLQKKGRAIYIYKDTKQIYKNNRRIFELWGKII